MNDDENKVETTGKLRRLPLWKNALDALRERKLQYGGTVSVTEFEELLAAKDGTRDFNLGVSKIRRELEKDGFYLDGHGKTKSGQFTICHANQNMEVAHGRQRRANDELARGLLLLSATARTELTSEENRRLDAMAERIQIRVALAQRAIQAADIIRKHAPQILDAPSNDEQ